MYAIFGDEIHTHIIISLTNVIRLYNVTIIYVSLPEFIRVCVTYSGPNHSQKQVKRDGC